MKILKSLLLNSDALSKFVNSNNIAREDIFTIIADGHIAGLFTIFYYEEPKSEEEKKGFWG